MASPVDLKQQNDPDQPGVPASVASDGSWGSHPRHRDSVIEYLEELVAGLRSGRLVITDGGNRFPIDNREAPCDRVVIELAQDGNASFIAWGRLYRPSQRPWRQAMNESSASTPQAQ